MGLFKKLKAITNVNMNDIPAGIDEALEAELLGNLCTV